MNQVHMNLNYHHHNKEGLKSKVDLKLSSKIKEKDDLYCVLFSLSNLNNFRIFLIKNFS